MLLDVVACCCAKFETGQNFQPTTPNISFAPWSPKRSATMLDPFAQLFQHCWGHARSLRMVYKDLWVVSFPRCTAGPNIFGSCCIRLHTTANTHTTTPNIVGATMLGVVASVCTQPKGLITWSRLGPFVSLPGYLYCQVITKLNYPANPGNEFASWILSCLPRVPRSRQNCISGQTAHVFGPK